MCALAVDHISKSFNGKPVLTDISLTFEEGGIYALMGPSGCGKTTLLRILCGLEKPDAGCVHTPEGSRFSFMFQEDRLLEYMNAPGNIRFAAPSRTRAEAAAALSLLGIGQADLARPVREYSGGMKRRVALARTVLYPGDILVLDEPFKGLDETSLNLAVRFLLSRLTGRTLIMTTHSKSEAGLCGASLLYMPSYRSGTDQSGI